MAAAPRVLLVGPLHPKTQFLLEQEHAVARLWAAPDPDALLKELAASVEVLVTSSFHQAPASLLGALPRLKLVACFGVGVDGIDTAWCRAHGVAVTNTPEVLTEDVADLAVTLALAAVRGLKEADAFVQEGAWLRGAFPLRPSMRGRKVGVVGMGRIGQAIARRMEAFGCELAYHGPRPKALAYPFYADLKELATWAQVLILACPGGPATAGLVGREILLALGPSGHLVNVARGSVVDQAALIECLQAGALAGAALDVFQDEPRVPAALLGHPKVLLQPHHASATHETRAAMGQLVLANLRAFVAGEPLVSPLW
jgi:hydroxypyruvate reductase